MSKATTAGIQRRSAKQRPVITRADGKPATIAGYGAVFYDAADPGTEYRLWQDTFERIAAGAFDGAIKPDADVRSLFNHNENFVLGRTVSSPSTLSLSVDKTGLRYEVTPPDTQLVKDAVLAPIERGDVDGASIAFFPRKVAWISEERDGRQVEIRELQEIWLVEVGPVTFPAYSSTSAGVRDGGPLDGAEVESLMAERAELLKHGPGPGWPAVSEVDLRALAIAAHQLSIGNRARG